MSIVKRELVPEKYKQKIISSFEKICVEILNNLIIKLKNDSKDIYHYESKIFNYSREKIRDVINHFSEIMKERGYVTSFKKEDGIYIYTLAESNKIVKVKVNKVQFKEKNVKWLISYMPLGEDFKDFLVDWYFIKIEQDKTLLAINNIYSEQMEPDLKKELTLKKKLLFQIIEEELIKRYP